MTAGRDNTNETLIFLLILPAVIILGVVGILVLDSWAERNSKVCEFIGKIWLRGDPNDLGVRKDCFTYEEMYEEED